MSLFGSVTIPGHPDLSNIRRLDSLPVPMIRRMMRLGIAIDREFMWDLSSQFAEQMDDLRRDISAYIPPERLSEFVDAADQVEKEAEDEENDNPDRELVRVVPKSAYLNPSSAEQIGKLLFDILGVGKDKQLKMTKKGDRLSTGKKQLETVRHDHPIVPKILAYREVSKLRSTYTETLPRLARFHPRGPCCPLCELSHDTDQWRVHGEIGTTRAETGRFNHKNPNLGNIPTRTDNGQLVQAGFVAPPGKVLATRDLSQIELRDLAHLANAHSMISVYLNDGDIHDNTARKVFNLPPEVKPDKIKHRMASKRTNFGIQNGTTEKGLYLQLVMDYGMNGLPVPEWLTEEWCKWFIDQWLETYPEVRDFFDLQWYRARRYGFVWEPFGRVRLVPEVRSTHRWIQEAGLRQAQNMPVTSLAAAQMKMAMGRCEAVTRRLWDGGTYVWPLMTIHDALIFEVDEDDADDVQDVLDFEFSQVMMDEETGEDYSRVPIKSDGDCATRWVK